MGAYANLGLQRVSGLALVELFSCFGETTPVFVWVVMDAPSAPEVTRANNIQTPKITDSNLRTEANEGCILAP